MKVLLTTPLATTQDLWGQYSKGAGAFFPHGLSSIAAVSLKEGFDVRILDASTLRLSEESFSEFLREGGFDIIGIGNCYTSLTPNIFKTAALCRAVLPGAKLIIGGAHPTIFPEETMHACPQVDVIVYGEGEYSFLELLCRYRDGREDLEGVKGIAFKGDGKVIVNAPSTSIENLDAIPMFPYHQLPMDLYVPPPSNYKRLPTYSMLVQRGCPHRCIYCDTRIHGPLVRKRSADSVLAEMKYLVDRYGMKGAVFHDSIFTADKKRTVELCERMIDENIDLSWTCYTRADKVDFELLKLMKEAGCWGVAYGIESGNQGTLDRVRKRMTIQQVEDAVAAAKRAKLQAIGSIILCLPGEDEAMVKNTIGFTKKLKLDTVVFFLPVPFPGTALYEMCKEEGGLAEDIKWEDYREWMDPKKLLYINPKIGEKKMRELYNYAFRSFYLSWPTLLRAFRNIRSIADVRKYLMGFRSIKDLIWKGLRNK